MYPAQWVNRGVWMEIPYAVSCMVHKLEESSAVWQAVKAEYSYSQAAVWVHTLMTDKVLTWVDDMAIHRIRQLDDQLISNGPGRQAMLTTFITCSRPTR